MSTVVVLPAAFGPSRAKTSPTETVRSIPATASTSPYVFRSPRTTMASSIRSEATGSGRNVAGRLVDHVHQRPAGEIALEVANEQLDRRLLPSGRVAGHVRRDDHVRHRPQRALGRQGLLLEH